MSMGAAVTPPQGQGDVQRLRRDPHVPPTSEEAMFLAALARQGIAVEYVAGSKMESLLGPRLPARFVRTDRGVVEVLFLGGADGAVRAKDLRICEGRQGSRFTYALVGIAREQLVDANRRLYFAVGGGVFTMTASPALHSAVQQALGAAPVPC
ncbi:MAG: hypothetical protein ACRDJN_23575 [Chloroflexota bacterium]